MVLKRVRLGCVVSLALGHAVLAGDTELAYHISQGTNNNVAGFSRIDIPLTFDDTGHYVVDVSTVSSLIFLQPLALTFDTWYCLVCGFISSKCQSCVYDGLEYNIHRRDRSKLAKQCEPVRFAILSVLIMAQALPT